MDSCNDRYVGRANELYPNAVINAVRITANVIVWCKKARTRARACSNCGSDFYGDLT